MELQHLESYRTPEYPTQDDLRQDVELLRSVPRRWRGKRAVLGALAGALALMNQSCTSNDSKRSILVGGTKVVKVPTEDETRAAHDLEWRRKSSPDWAPVPGGIMVPRSAIPEDETKAAADQTANGQQTRHR